MSVHEVNLVRFANFDFYRAWDSAPTPATAERIEAEIVESFGGRAEAWVGTRTSQMRIPEHGWLGFFDSYVDAVAAARARSPHSYYVRDALGYSEGVDGSMSHMRVPDTTEARARWFKGGMPQWCGAGVKPVMSR